MRQRLEHGGWFKMNTVENKGHYRIYGNINGKRGGAFFGFSNGIPSFGGGNLIYAPIWWDHTKDEMNTLCNEIKQRYADCEVKPTLIEATEE